MIKNVGADVSSDPLINNILLIILKIVHIEIFYKSLYSSEEMDLNIAAYLNDISLPIIAKEDLCT